MSGAVVLPERRCCGERAGGVWEKGFRLPGKRSMVEKAAGKQRFGVNGRTPFDFS